MSDEEKTRFTERFFKKRFPDRNIEYNKGSGYFYVWKKRLFSIPPQDMDSQSLIVYKQLLEEDEQ